MPFSVFSFNLSGQLHVQAALYRATPPPVANERGYVELQSRCGRFGEGRNTLRLPEIESRFLDRKANGLVTVGWTKHRLRHDATGLPTGLYRAEYETAASDEREGTGNKAGVSNSRQYHRIRRKGQSITMYGHNSLCYGRDTSTYRRRQAQTRCSADDRLLRGWNYPMYPGICY